MVSKYSLRVSEILSEDYSELRSTLSRLGITFFPCDTPDASGIRMVVDHERLNRSIKRNAGAKEKGLYLTGSPSAPVYLADIERLKKEFTMSEIAAMYNTSRRTLYRRIAEAKRSGSDQLY